MKYEEVNKAGTGFYPIYKFMERELNLKCNELRVYALLFSFSVGRVGMFYGSRKYLADSLSISERTVYRILKTLFARSLIENVWDKENSRGGIRCTYVGKEQEEKRENPTFIEKCRENAFDGYVRRNYGDLSAEDYKVVRAAAEDKFDRLGRERELEERVERIRKMMLSPLGTGK